MTAETANSAALTSPRIGNLRVLRVAETIVIPGLALVASALTFSLFLLIIGKDPVQFWSLVWIGGFGSSFSIQNSLQRAAPLILTGLAFAVPARIGLTMIGGEGALVLGGFTAAAVAIPLVTGGVPPMVTLPTMALTGILTGALWVGFTGWLKYARGVNETISSLLLNYIAIAVIVGRRAHHADRFEIFDRGNVFMAFCTFVHFDFERMRVVTTDAGIIACHMCVLRIVRETFVLVTAHRFAAVQRCGCGIIMDVPETEEYIIALIVLDGGDHGVRICRAESFDLRVHTDFRLAPLVAFHAADVIPGCDRYTGGEGDRGLRERDCIVTSHTLDPLRFCRRDG